MKNGITQATPVVEARLGGASAGSEGVSGEAGGCWWQRRWCWWRGGEGAEVGGTIGECELRNAAASLEIASTWRGRGQRAGMVRNGGEGKLVAAAAAAISGVALFVAHVRKSQEPSEVIEV